MRPGLDRLSSIRVDGSRNHIHPAEVRGRYTRWRTLVAVVLIAVYIAVPWLELGGHPAILLDIEARRFYLFGATFNAQDVWLVVFLITAFGFGLMFSTAWLGRLWCGWACPQTVFLEKVFRRIEVFFDGGREQRRRLQEAPWALGKALRRVAKHAAFLAVSLVLAHVALSFFVSLRQLFAMVQADPREHWTAFVWVMGITALVYFDFAWFREQLCIIVCPYGRLQSVLADRDSITVGYDVGRGEPRGKLTRQERAAGTAARKGDCVDCGRCVAACPTGIDIRDGQQLECVACASCADACDGVMAKLGRPRGLIRYDSQRGLAGEPRRHALRPRLVAYGALFAAASLALVVGLALRTPFEANLLRVRGAPYVFDGATVRNSFELHLVNKGPERATFEVQVTAPGGVRITLPAREVALGSLESFRLPLFLDAPRAGFAGPFEFGLTVRDAATGETKVVPGRFLGPAS